MSGFIWSALAGFGAYLLGFLTASIIASGKVADLLDEIDAMRSGR